MKGRWLAAVACLAVLASCEKPKTDVAPATGEPRKTSSPERGPLSQLLNGSGNGNATKPADPPAAPEKGKEPVAQGIADRPGYVLSPYDGKVVDVTGLPPGTLVQDPSFPLEEKKFFRVPEPPPAVVPPVAPGASESAEASDPEAPHPEDDGALGR